MKEPNYLQQSLTCKYINHSAIYNPSKSYCTLSLTQERLCTACMCFGKAADTHHVSHGLPTSCRLHTTEVWARGCFRSADSDMVRGECCFQTEAVRGRDPWILPAFSPSAGRTCEHMVWGKTETLQSGDSRFPEVRDERGFQPQMWWLSGLSIISEN